MHAFVVCGLFLINFKKKKKKKKKKTFRNTIRVSNSLDTDQAQRFVGPDLGPNCLQRLSTDDKIRHWRKKVNEILNQLHVNKIFMK